VKGSAQSPNTALQSIRKEPKSGTGGSLYGRSWDIPPVLDIRRSAFEMVRVIAGKFKNTRLKTLEGKATRPTSDRLKETLFNVMQDRIQGTVFLDAYAGSGSIGIEALSRGAEFAAFIEPLPQAGRIILENLMKLKSLNERDFLLLGLTAERALKRLSQMPKKFDIVYIDPPYAAWEEYPNFFEQVQEGQLLSERAMIIAEHSCRLTLQEQFGQLIRFRELKQGDSVLSFYQI
jgi:16S rRNA (guanine966-N2)-methyltransferase